MKLLSSFIKELKLASRGFYFYIEIFMAALILVLFLFVVPDNFSSKGTEYLYLEMPPAARNMYLAELREVDLDGQADAVKIKIAKEEKDTLLFTTEDKKIYILNSREDVIYMADKERKMAAVVKMDSDYKMSYEYYLQGHESARLKDLLKILHVESTDVIEAAMDAQEVRPLATDFELLSDKENTIPSVLVFNGSLMGLFIIAAYVFLDRQEDVIKAYAVTPSPVWQYLISKVGVITIMSILSSLIVVLPIMGLKPDYLLLLALLLTTGFFSSALGLLIASFYDDLIQSFGMIFGFLILMIIPNIAFFLPSWNPSWVKVLPSYPMLLGFKSVVSGAGEVGYVLGIAGGFLVAGTILFLVVNTRYKKNL